MRFEIFSMSCLRHKQVLSLPKLWLSIAFWDNSVSRCEFQNIGFCVHCSLSLERSGVSATNPEIVGNFQKNVCSNKIQSKFTREFPTLDWLVSSDAFPMSINASIILYAKTRVIYNVIVHITVTLRTICLLYRFLYKNCKQVVG